MIKMALVGVWAIVLLFLTLHCYREFERKGGMARYFLTLTFLSYSVGGILTVYSYWIAFSKGDVVRIAYLNVLLDITVIVTTLLLFSFFNDFFQWSRRKVYLVFIFAGVVLLIVISHVPEIIIVDDTPIALRTQYKSIALLCYMLIVWLSICYNLFKNSKSIIDIIAVVRVRTIAVGLLLHLIGFVIIALKSSIIMRQYIYLLDLLTVITFVSAIVIFYVGFVAPSFILNIFKRSRTYQRYIIKYGE